MSRYFTADWHFGHYTNEERGVIQFCLRPWPAKRHTPEMNAALIARIRDRVKDEDELIVVGDCFFQLPRTMIEAIMGQIPGRKILVRGNHDRRTSNKKFLELGFAEVHKYLKWYDEQLNRDILVVHDPVESIVCPEAITLCGHVHQLWRRQGRCINVGVDVWDYAPVSYDELHHDMLIADLTPFAEVDVGHRKKNK